MTKFSVEVDSIEEIDLLIYGVVAFLNEERKQVSREWNKLKRKPELKSSEVDEFWFSQREKEGKLLSFRNRICAQRDAYAMGAGITGWGLG